MTDMKKVFWKRQNDMDISKFIITCCLERHVTIQGILNPKELLEAAGLPWLPRISIIFKYNEHSFHLFAEVKISFNFWSVASWET